MYCVMTLQLTEENNAKKVQKKIYYFVRNVHFYLIRLCISIIISISFFLRILFA